MTDIENRLRDMEASIKTIAEYVKQQTTKIEEEVSAAKSEEPPADHKDELEDLRRRIDAFAEEKEFSRLQFKKLDKLEQVLDERVGRIEELARGAHLDEKFRKTLQSTRTEIDSTKRDVQSKMKFLEEKLDRIEEKNDVHELEAEIKAEIQKLEKELEETKSSTKRSRDVDLDSYKKELESLNYKMLDEFKARIAASEKGLGDIASKIENFGGMQLQKDFEKFQNDVLSRLHILDKSIKEIADGADTEELKEYVGMIDNKLNESLVLKNHLDDMEKSLDEMKAIAGRLRGFDAESYKKEFERRMSDMIAQFEGRDALEERKNTGLQGIEIARQLKETKELLEDESVSRISMEKRLGGIESNVERFENYINDTLSHIKNLEVSDVKKLNTALEHLKDVEFDELKEIANNIKEARAALEDESVNRLSNEKRMSDIENKLNRVDGVVGHIENVEGLDVEKLSNRIQDIESNMKMNTVRLLTQQLNEFAKSIDRRLPNIVSREEYTRQIADLNQRMRTIEAPDLAPLGARVERLEQKIEEVAAMMRGMYNRIPIIVE